MSPKIIVAIAAVALTQTAFATMPRVGSNVEISVDAQGLRSSQEYFYEDFYDSASVDTAGKASLSYSYPNLPPGGAGYATSSTDAGYGASALAGLDISAGKIHVHDSAWVYSGSDSNVYGWVHNYSTAEYTDIIHLEQPARVTLTGQIHGSLFGLVNGEYSSPSAGIGARIGFYEWVGGEIGYEQIGIDQIFRPTFVDTTNVFYMPGMQPQPAPISASLSYTWDLPAGDHYFSASLDAGLALMVDPGGSSLGQMGFENTATFQLLIPEGVTATSDLGTPIAVPEPSCLALLGTIGVLFSRRRRA